MADFCRACSIAIFGDDFKELASITDPEQWKLGKATCVLCEGCGPIQVDPNGNCVSRDCLHEGEPGHGLPWIHQAKDTQE